MVMCSTGGRKAVDLKGGAVFGEIVFSVYLEKTPKMHDWSYSDVAHTNTPIGIPSPAGSERRRGRLPRHPPPLRCRSVGSGTLSFLAPNQGGLVAPQARGLPSYRGTGLAGDAARRWRPRGAGGVVRTPGVVPHRGLFLCQTDLSV